MRNGIGPPVAPLAMSRFESTFFEDRSRFPAGSIEMDHALLMLDVDHRWVSQPDLVCPSA